MPEWTPASHYERHLRRQNPDPNEWLGRFGMQAAAPNNPQVNYAPAPPLPVAAAPAGQPIQITVNGQQPAAVGGTLTMEDFLKLYAPKPIQVVRRLPYTIPSPFINTSYSMPPQRTWTSYRPTYPNYYLPQTNIRSIVRSHCSPSIRFAAHTTLILTC